MSIFAKIKKKPIISKDMQIFEFHFNPKAKEELILDSFIYEPENVYEKKLGSLYIAGEITNALPQNYRFLNNLASTVKEGFYKLSAENSPEKALKTSLKAANKFLEEQEENGDVSWLGNINMVVISIKDFKLNFAKVGDIKILLFRGKKMIDIGQQLESKDLEPLSLKIFSNIVSGKLAPEDKLIILTKEIFELFEKEEIFSEALSVFSKNLEPEKIDRELKKTLNQKRDILTKVSGLFLLIALESLEKEVVQIKKPVTTKKKIPLNFLPSLPLPKIKLKGARNIITQMLSFNIGIVKKITSWLSKKTRIKKPSLLPKEKIQEALKKPSAFIPKKIPSLPKKMPSIPRGSPSFRIPDFKKLIVLIVILIIVLSIGNQIFKAQRQKKVERIQAILNEVQEIVVEAENAFIFNDLRRANLLYQEAWQMITPLAEEEDIPLANEVISLKESIEEELFPINKLEKITDPQIALELNLENFSPQKMIFSDSGFYFFNLQSDKVYRPDGSSLQLPDQPKFGIRFKDILLFLSQSNQLMSLRDNQISTNELNFPYSNPEIIDFYSYNRYLYLLDSNQGEVIKFELEGNPQLPGGLWLKPETKKLSEAKLIAVDGSIWILNEDNTLNRYYLGELQDKFNLDFFPAPEGTSKLFTQDDFLYLLTPGQKRIVILDKTGQTVKQYRSDKFDNLTDFSISENGKTIYLLNGLTVYQIEL